VEYGFNLYSLFYLKDALDAGYGECHHGIPCSTYIGG